MSRAKYTTSTSMMDTLFNLLIIFISLFLLSMMMVNPKKKEQAAQTTKAEFLITLEWDKESKDDVDLHVMDPAKNKCFFSRREQGLMNLDRDDLGKENDVIITPYGTFKFDENREMISLRGGTIPGEYVVNVHLYRKDGTALDDGTVSDDKSRKINVWVTLEKMNPYILQYKRTITITRQGEERTMFRFVVDDKGVVSNVNELNKSIIKAEEH